VDRGADGGETNRRGISLAESAQGWRGSLEWSIIENEKAQATLAGHDPETRVSEERLAPDLVLSIAVHTSLPDL